MAGVESVVVHRPVLLPESCGLRDNLGRIKLILIAFVFFILQNGIQADLSVVLDRPLSHRLVDPCADAVELIILKILRVVHETVLRGHLVDGLDLVRQVGNSRR